MSHLRTHGTTGSGGPSHITADCPDKNKETGLMVAFNVEVKPEDQFAERGFEDYRQQDLEFVQVVR
jgi:hypothetical protein